MPYYVSSGFYSGGIVLRNDFMYVSSGGTANSTVILSGGSLNVSYGGTATNIVWTPCVGSIYAMDSAYATTASQYSGIYCGSAHQLLFQERSITSQTLYYGSEMHVYDGGTLNYAAVNGNLTIHKGGTANSTVIGANGFVWVRGDSESGLLDHDRGVWGDTVGNGGRINGVTVNPCASLYVGAGGSASNISVSSGGLLYLSVAPRTYAQGNYNGSNFRMENGQISNYTVQDSCILYVLSGGKAENITVATGATLSVHSGGSARNVKLNSNAKIFFDVAPGTYVQGTAGYSSFEMNNGFLSGYSCGYCQTVTVSSGGRASDTTVGSFGVFSVSSGGTAVNTVVSSGNHLICSGGLSIDPVLRNGIIYLDSGGRITGRMTFDRYTQVIAGTGGIVDFDLSKASLGDNPLVNDLSCLSGSPRYTLTVNGSLANGTYSLANGASGFNGSISVVNTSGSQLGTLSVGQTAYIGGVNYTLNLSNGTLSVTRGGDGGNYGYDDYNYGGSSSYYDDYNYGGYSSDSYGYNHSFADAYYLGSNTSVRTATGASIASAGEEDYYSFTLTQSATVTLSTSGESGGDTILYLYNANQILLTYNDDAGSDYYSVISQTLAPGTYYAKVQAYDNSMIGNYSLAASVQMIGGGNYGYDDYNYGGSSSYYDDYNYGGSSSYYDDYYYGGSSSYYDDYYGYDDYGGDYDYGGFKYINAGQTSNGLVADSEYDVVVYSGGTANNTFVKDDGWFEVYGVANNTTVGDYGSMLVYSGGRANGVNVQKGGEFHVYSGGTATNVSWTPIECWVSFDSGATVTFANGVSGVYYGYRGERLISRATVMTSKTLGYHGNSEDKMIVLSGGTAVSIIVSDGGELQVSSGGTAIDTTVGQNGSANYYSVDDGGYLTVGNGGTAINVTVRNTGYLVVGGGGKLTGRIYNGGGIHFNSGGILDFDLTRTSPGAAALVNDLSGFGYGSPIYTLTVDGNQANGTYKLADGASNFYDTLKVVNASGYEYGRLNVGYSIWINDRKYSLNLSGGTLSVTVAVIDETAPEISLISGSPTTTTTGSVTVSAAFTDNVAVDEIYYKLGENGTWRTCSGSVTVTENAIVFFKAVDTSGNESNVYGYIVNNIVKPKPAKPTASANATATTNQAVTVTATFGSDTATKQYSLDGQNWSTYTTGVRVTQNGTVYFRGLNSEGTASDVTAYAVSNIDLVAPEISRISGSPTTTTTGSVTVSAAFTDNVAVAATYYKLGENGTWRTYSNSVTVTENAIVSFKAVDAAGNESNVYSYVVNNISSSGNTSSGGSTGSGSIVSSGNRVVSAGQTSSGLTVLSGGSLIVSSGGTATGTTVSSYMYVCCGGVANSTAVKNDDARLYISSGGVANSTTISHGRLYISSGGMANGTTISHGELHVSGVANSNNIIYGGVRVYSGGVINDMVYTGGWMDIQQGGSANRLTINRGGSVRVSSGVIMNSTSVSSGGYLYVYSGGKLTGQTTINYNANVSISTGAILDFDISVLAPGATARINDLSRLSDWSNASFTLTVGGSQTNGTYSLAENASGFNKTISVVNASGAQLGTLAVGQTVTISGVSYSLTLSGGSLTVTVSGGSSAPGPALTPEKLASFTGDFAGNGRALLAVKDENLVSIYRNKGVVWGELTLDDGWDAAGVGDFDGDGADDILRVHTSGLVVGEMSDGYGEFSPQVLNFRSDGWSILGTGDFNHNGKDDVLIANPTGASETVGLLGYWESGVTWTLINGYSAEWECVATGDFNGDGKCDMLWRNSFVGDGGLTYNAYCTWIVDPPAGQSDWRMVSVSNPSEWDFLCAGDFDGDGMHDIAMINGEGVVGIWGVNNGYLNSWSILSAVTPEWQLAGVGDFNGDKTDDIAWSSASTGLTGYWQINDKTLTTWQNIATLQAQQAVS